MSERLIQGTFITLQTLIDLRKIVPLEQQINSKKHLVLYGSKQTQIRGRGIEFDATREYQAGDDIRCMAWRVTARSLKPHVKVYREEKEKSLWLVLDLSPSMFFGTRVMFKSVKIIRQAVLCGWHALSKQEKIGAFISNEKKPQIFTPQASGEHYLRLLQALAQASQREPNFYEQEHLNALLLSLQQQVRAGSLVHIYSDFLSFNAETEKLLLYLRTRAEIILHFVYDPFEAVPPPPDRYVLTNGQQKMLFDMEHAKNRDAYQTLFEIKVKQLKDFAHKHDFILQSHCTES